LNTTALAQVSNALVTSTTAQAANDAHLVDLWLHGRPKTTRRAYRADVARFLAYVDRPLQAVTLGDVQAFADDLQGLAPASRARVLSSVKSLLAFGHKLGYLAFDVGRALRLPARKNTLAQRILPEADVQRVLALEENPRNRALLLLFYATGGRVSEVCSLTWADCQERDAAGQVTLYGKGGKTRAVLLSPATWRELESLRGNRSHDESGSTPVFRSRKKGGCLGTEQAWRIVKAAAVRAGVDPGASPHWFRHAHASHALDRGAPVHLVQQTLGHASVATTGRYLHAKPTDSSARYLGV
jgi:site-specific recombinase XerD